MADVTETQVEDNQDKVQIINQIRTKLEEIRDLPTLPVVAQEARRIIDDPNSNMNNLVHVIEGDMALTSRILRIANSAYYGVPRKIDNLKMALVILGMKEINNLVTTITVMRLFPSDHEYSTFDIPRFWKHSAICAELTIGLYEGLRMHPPSSAYIAGLLHDVGKLVLAQYFFDYFLKCLKIAVDDELSLAEAEINTLGIDHGHIGSWLIKRWNIPDEICDAVAKHHVRPANSPRFDLAAIVDWADRLYYLIEGRFAKQVTALLEKDPDWNLWKASAGYPTGRVVEMLFTRLNRSLTLLNIIR